MTLQAMLVTHREVMLRAARRLTRNADAAEDVVQIACLNVLGSKNQSASLDNPEAWLTTCVRHAFYRWKRTENRYAPNGDQIAAREVMDGAQYHSVVLSDVRRSMEKMTSRCRAAFDLVWIQGMTNVEAGAALGVSAEAVLARCVRAKAALLAA